MKKYGYYKMKKTYENQKTNLLDKINDLEKRNKIMANDMKKEKFPDGALVYIIDYSDEDTSVDGYLILCFCIILNLHFIHIYMNKTEFLN